MRRRNTLLIAGLVGALLATTQVGTAQASGGPPNCANRNNNTVAKLMQCVTLAGVRQHQLALQLIANASGGNRFAGNQGHNLSAAYVMARLKLAGYKPVLQPFDYVAYRTVGPSTMSQTAPAPTTYVEGVDFAPMDQSDPGTVTDRAVTPVNLTLEPPRISASACDPADFAGFPVGNVALIQRGSCSFEDKAENAAAAGASGVIIFNEGNESTPDRQGIPDATLGGTNTAGIPVVGATYPRGAEWATTPGLRVSFFVNTNRQTKTTYNVIADTNTGDDTNVIVVGAHLDSVLAGPGINDNGSGSAAILEVALQMKKVKPKNTVRFAWWSAEEANLVGSDFYVGNLSDEERGDIALNLNFDMIGSPNFARMVYDGSGDAFGLAGPPGSAAIEAFFDKFYADRGLAFEPTEISFRSDYSAFFTYDIPFGGLFTGAEGRKTAAQVALYGGTEGAQFDPCYHQACDTFANNNDGVLDVNSDAVAASVLTYAMSTATVDAEQPAASALRAGAAAARTGKPTGRPAGKPTE